MTPEDSQSSEELVHSERSHTASPSSSSNTDPPIRVRNVAEINSTEADGTSSQESNCKRIPSSPTIEEQECSSPKRRREENANDNDGGASTSRAALQRLEVFLRNSLYGDAPETTQPNESTSATKTVPNPDEDASTSCEIIEDEPEVEIKVEPQMELEPIPSTSHGYSTPTRAEEPVDDGIRIVGEILPPSPDIKPATEVQKEEATSSTMRPTCQFGSRCTRQNPAHRHEEAHPGDPDYRRPCYPPAPITAPHCPYGVNCYRRNPIHYQQYNHPSTTDFFNNWRMFRMNLRTRRRREDPNANFPSSSSTVRQDSSGESDDDPVFNEESEEFMPNEEDEEEDDEEYE